MHMLRQEERNRHTDPKEGTFKPEYSPNTPPWSKVVLSRTEPSPLCLLKAGFAIFD